jgi:hypothetical protein
MSWLRVGDWIVSVNDVVAVRYDEGTVDIYTRGDRFREKGGFSAKGEEAEKLWAYFCALSTNVEAEEDVHGGYEPPREAPRGRHLTIR